MSCGHGGRAAVGVVCRYGGRRLRSRSAMAVMRPWVSCGGGGRLRPCTPRHLGGRAAIAVVRPWVLCGGWKRAAVGVVCRGGVCVRGVIAAAGVVRAWETCGGGSCAAVRGVRLWECAAVGVVQLYGSCGGAGSAAVRFMLRWGSCQFCYRCHPASNRDAGVSRRLRGDECSERNAKEETHHLLIINTPHPSLRDIHAWPWTTQL